MIRTAIPLLALVLVAACADSRNRAPLQGEDVEAENVVSIHPGIDNRVRYVKHSVGRTEDGRMSIVVVLDSRSRRDRALVVDTQWFDDEGNTIERGTPRQILIPRGQNFIYRDTSYATEATSFSVSVRQAEPRRKR